MKITETATVKRCTSPDYNSAFDKRSGMFLRWGRTEADDPVRAPFPEIVDIEIATACDGVPQVAGGRPSPCAFCYKSNVRTGEQMSLETFKVIFDKLPKGVTQIAFGIANLYGHDDMWRIFEYTREHGVIPNVTINGWALTDEVADRLASVMGAVAVSRYQNTDLCYDAVKKLTDRGMKQVNIHQLVSQDTYESCFQALRDAQADPRLEKLNAIVFLALKPKGRGERLTQLRDRDRFKALVDFALERGVNIGFDSCSVPNFLTSVEGHQQFAQFEQATDRCESGLFSLYIDVKGTVWPCSFGEERSDLEPISLLEVEDFSRDVWESPAMERWRNRLLSNDRNCPLHDLRLT